MFNVVMDASPTLRKFLEARSNGASEKELKALQAADEAAHASNQPEPHSAVVIDLHRARIERERP
jgi:hypothetical protein